MVFSSSIFLFAFLPGLLILYALSWKKSLKLSNVILLIGSLFFILWGSGEDTIILFSMIIINYISGLLLTFKSGGNLLVKGAKRTVYQKTVIILTLVLSLSLLVYFKYAYFISSSSESILKLIGINYETPKFIKNILLPLGISFYTFQALSYSLDVYFGKVESTKSLLNFSLYVSFFPQLIAGPIVRYADIYKQINKREINLDSVYSGMLRFMTGFTKKVLLANTLAKAVDSIYALPLSELHMAITWIASLAYTLQIYMDFSAYSDMAIGLAKIFGFKLRENFNLPYIASSVQDFWRRWHISLSSWFRDYLYIPLGGNRKGNTRTYLNSLIVFFVCGLWHGAAWNFVIWGLWHGFFLAVERAFLGKVLDKMPKFFGHIYTLLVVNLGLIMFRSDNISYALSFIKTLFVPKTFSGHLFRLPTEFLQNDIIIAFVFALLSSAGLIVWFKKKCDANGKICKNIFTIIVILLFILSITSIYSGTYNPFIYFRF